jgi:hypothetical protein
MSGVIYLLTYVLLFLAPLATFALAARQGRWRMRAWTVEDGSRAALFWTGVLGLILYSACTLFAIFDDPAARIVDCIDWGAWTGVPTVLVILLYLYTFALLVALGGFNVYRTIRKKLTSG